MESPFTNELQRLRRRIRLSFQIATILFILTIGLAFLPGVYYLLTLIPALISILVAFGSAFDAEIWEQSELKWRIRKTMDQMIKTAKEKSSRDLDTDD